MDSSPTIEHALRRLSNALDLLEAAASRRAEADAARATLEEELAVMQDDRARLATDLDAASARNRVLDQAQTQVIRRLERTSATIRAILSDVETGGADEAEAG